MFFSISPQWISRAKQSIRIRLLVGTILWMSIALLVTGVALAWLFNNHVERQHERELELQLTQLVANIEVSADGVLRLDHPLADQRFNQPLSGLYWQIEQPGRDIVLRSRSLWDSSLRLVASANLHMGSQFFKFTGPNNEKLLIIERKISASEAPDQPFWVAVASDTKPYEEAIQEWVYLLVIFLGILFLSLVAAAIAQVRLGLTPLRNLEQAVHQLAKGRIKRLEGDFPKEIDPLIQEFNQVLAQNDAMIQRAQNRAGDFAHSMKTPLTILANASNLPSINTPSDRMLATLVSEQVSVMREQVDQQLLQARKDAMLVLHSHQTDIAPVIRQIVRTIKKIHQDKALVFEVDIRSPTATFPGEAGALQEMLGNLIDNASKWARSTINITCFSDGTLTKILVEDDGPGVPESDMKKLTLRGIRADERKPGSGLGLSIVSELASVHGGKLTLGKSFLGGLSATITFVRSERN